MSNNMYTVRKAKQSDFININIQDAQYIEPEIMEKWDSSGVLANPCWTILVNDEIVFIGGVMPIHQKRSVLWAFLSKHSGPHLRLITKETKKVINQFKNIRLEVVVDSNFENGHQWAKLLGFKHEGKLICYMENGSDADIYSQIVI